MKKKIVSPFLLSCQQLHLPLDTWSLYSVIRTFLTLVLVKTPFYFRVLLHFLHRQTNITAASYVIISWFRVTTVHSFLDANMKLFMQNVASLHGESEAVYSELNVNEHDTEMWVLAALSNMLHVETFMNAS